MSETAQAKATKVRVLVGATVEADLDGGLSYSVRHGYATPERKAEELERLVREFNEHIRDHRSQDFVRLHVQRVIEDQCSACRQPWETATDDDGVVACAWCGAPT